MKLKCSRNGCPKNTHVRILRKIDGHYYNVPVCDDHKDGLTPNDD